MVVEDVSCVEWENHDVVKRESASAAVALAKVAIVNRQWWLRMLVAQIGRMAKL
jgi:hypothetical protein